MTTNAQIRELESMSSVDHLPLEKRLIDTAVWYNKNKKRIPAGNLPKRCEFLEKTCDILIELLALTVTRIQGTEGRPKGSMLWLPNGINVEGDLSSFGKDE